MQNPLSLLIVAYLFLGGAGAGAFAVLACIDFRYLRTEGSVFAKTQGSGSAGLSLIEKRHLSNLTKRGYVASFAFLALGAICLLADLGRPEIAYMLFTRPTFSYISMGTYSLTILLLSVLLLIFIGNFSLPKMLNRARPVILLVGFISSIFVMTYTGIFLQSMGANALWDSPLLIALFFLSALSTGIALVVVCSTGFSLKRTAADLLRHLAKLDLVVVVLEAVVCVAYLVAVSSTDLGAQSVKSLLTGEDSTAFIAGFVLCGLVAPGIMNAASITRKHAEWIDLTMACLVLIGGFCLRLSLFEARIHSSI